MIEPWGCIGKTPHLSKALALQSIRKRRRVRNHSGRKGLTAYLCRLCKHWHIGSSQQ